MKSVINIIITTYAPSTLKHITHLPKTRGWKPFLPKLKRKAKDAGTEYGWNIPLIAFANAALLMQNQIYLH